MCGQWFARAAVEGLACDVISSVFFVERLITWSARHRTLVKDSFIMCVATCDSVELIICTDGVINTTFFFHCMDATG